MITKQRVLRQLDQTWVAFDQLFNVLTGGWADETFSSRTWRCKQKYPFKVLLHVINALAFNKDHCYQAYVQERLRDDLPPELRVD